MLPHQTTAWAELEQLASAGPPRILDLFAAEPGRLAARTIATCGIHFDFSKLPLSARHFSAMEALARAAQLPAWRRRLQQGEVVNDSEQEAACHMALRQPERRAAHQPMLRFAREVRSGALGPIRNILHIGIGGSALGPHLLLDSLPAPCIDGHEPPGVRILSNIDGHALDRALAGCDAADTLILAVSKSFSTRETLFNLEAVNRWQRQNGLADPASRTVAITACPKRASAHGIRHVLPFQSSLGGRFSLWSAVSLAFVLRHGEAAFLALLDGANAMDRHFLAAPAPANAPVVAALADVWLASFARRPTRGVFVYDERLRLLPAYLQQLVMESNGKRVGRDGTPLPFPTAPVLWGGTGTDCQHAMFQLLHQGTHDDPVEFIAVATPGSGRNPGAHRQLLANCIAQSAALLHGSDAMAPFEPGNETRFLPGNHGSATFILDRLDAERLGALLAFYEARTFAAGVLMGINSFDQWGVELGKELASRLAEDSPAVLDPSTDALLQAAGLATPSSTASPPATSSPAPASSVTPSPATAHAPAAGVAVSPGAP